MVLLPFAAVFLGIILVLIRYSLWRKKYCQNLPGIEPGLFNIPGDLTIFLMRYVLDKEHPILYHFGQVMNERNKIFQQKQLFYIWGFYKPHIFFVKAEAVKQLLSKGNGAEEKSWHYEFLKPILGTGLITSSVDKWKPRRKLLTPCFHADILRGFLTVFNERSQKLVEHLRKETKEEFTYISSPVTLTALDIIFETMLGTSVEALKKNNAQYIIAMNNFVKVNSITYVLLFRRLADMFMARMVKFWEWPNFIFDLTTGKEQKRLQKIIHDFTASVIQEKKMQYLSGNRENAAGKRKAFMDLLLENHFETKELSEEDICEEVNTFVAAGHETIAITIAWTLYLIGLYPDVQTKIHEELDRIFGTDEKRHVKERDLNDLEYLDCVLKETNRLYTAVPIIAKELQKDTNICGYTIPKESTCAILIYFLHRDKDVFPDPEKFDPDRFLPENAAKIPEYGYIPFSSGPRNCIGQKFAIMEMKTVISLILRNYTIESLDSRDKVLPIMQITLHPSVPIRVRIRPRKMNNIE
ncbi:cytochrome P450 4V2 [Nephila pilipes]|uniref:Cytochrome P450 4V2 n=1 Tax=Nephila pilipes TaxID=299642 RepID=A0A8X6PYT2_NEPPI|nr:cytochrome P450 4V2 [Nephila pilipes]